MKKTLFILATLLFMSPVFAQHEGHNHKHDTTRKEKKPQAPKQEIREKPAAEHDHAAHSHGTDTAKPKAAAAATDHAGHSHPGQKGEEGHGTHNMSHAFSLNLPMNRNGSGTSWLPDNSPMYGYMFHKNKWMYMLHGNLFLRYNKQDVFNKGSRGGSKVDAPNMVMLMGQRPVGKKGLFHFSSMLSLDPLTVGAEGYPLLFQTGETYKGKSLIDRQHPHDFISELSVSYAHALSPESDVFLYVGYPGEPALGPAAFVHRPSGFFNPDAPLTHHWIDATHITFGVATLGFRFGNWKIEGSSFTGREPGENRFDFDQPKFDSWSGRLSYNPNEKWAVQVSRGFIKEPEWLHPGEDVNRTTASVQYSNRGYGETFTNFTAVWGVNKTKGHSGEHGALLEGSFQKRRTSVYGRYEWVQKSQEELGIDEQEHGHDAIFPVQALTAGAGYDLFTIGSTKVAAGGQFTLYKPDERLTHLYGSSPVAAQIYLRIYPRAMGSKSGRFYLPY